MDYEIQITVDTNDADYITDVRTISQEDLDKIRPLIAAIKAFKPYKVKREGYSLTHDHNYPRGEYGYRPDLGEKSPEELYDFPEEIFELLEEFVPYGEYGFHDIKSIEVFPVTIKEKLL